MCLLHYIFQCYPQQCQVQQSKQQCAIIINEQNYIINFTQLMQELSLSVRERILKTKLVIQRQIDLQGVRNLREQEKIRCDRQSFILSMMRLNKVMSPHLKKSYYTLSYELMQLIQPNFQFKLINTIDEDFLNEFVHLHTRFFTYFQTRFTFKTKIQNFLRPTNHNIVVDLVKDCYVQTLFWKIKNSPKPQIATSSQNQIANSLQNNQDNNSSKVKPPGSIYRNFSNITQIDQNFISPKKKTDQTEQRRNNQKNYDILYVSISSLTVSVYKQNSLNIQSLKIKINQLFRQQKSRNGPMRKIYEQYIKEYNLKYRKNANKGVTAYQSPLKRSDQIHEKCLPYKMYLSVSKNGFSVIMLDIDNRKVRNSYFGPSNRFKSSSNFLSSSNSPFKVNQNSFSPLRISQKISQIQQATKADYFITSMKVLRASQNFLPPLMTTSGVVNNLKSSIKDLNDKQIKKDEEKERGSILSFSIKLKKMTDEDDEIDDLSPLIKEASGSNNILARSTSFKQSVTQKQRQDLQNYNNQIYMGHYQHDHQSIRKRSKRRESQDLNYRLSNRKLNFKKKTLVQGRKIYQRSNHSPSYNSKVNNQMNKQSQEKILQWLQKIKNLKEIQRRKIIGMNC